jgi:hypothetical protein
VIVATLGYSLIGENSSDLTEPVWTLCFVVCAILLLLPKGEKILLGTESVDVNGPNPRASAADWNL